MLRKVTYDETIGSWTMMITYLGYGTYMRCGDT